MPPLLAGRIEVALAFYRAQKEKTGQAPKLICSGGQGQDELCPEAVAMAAYIQDLGIPDGDVLLEKESKTTFENLVFAKKIMDELSEGRAYACLFATSDYHLLRTGMYAKQIGLRAEGIGARTARYYLPNALIREFVAYVVMHKKRYLFVTVGSLAVAFLLSVVFYLSR